jgi:ESS family glutamate:Na+ symporter
MQMLTRFDRSWVDGMIWKIATIDFNELAAAAAPFFFCCLVSALWVFLCFLCCGKLLPDYWVERAVMEVGLSLGATATALLVVSKNNLLYMRALCYSIALILSHAQMYS